MTPAHIQMLKNKQSFCETLRKCVHNRHLHGGNKLLIEIESKNYRFQVALQQSQHHRDKHLQFGCVRAAVCFPPGSGVLAHGSGYLRLGPSEAYTKPVTP